MRRALRPLARLRRDLTPSGRFERRSAGFQEEALRRLAAVDAEVTRVRRQNEDLVKRVTLLDRRTMAIGDGLHEVARRRSAPPAAKQPPPSVMDANVVLAGLREGGRHPRVVLVLNGLAVDAIFAGVRTALITAVELARRLERPLAVVVLTPLGRDPEDARGELARWLTDEVGAGDLVDDLTLSAPQRPRLDDAHPDDLWIATYWTTAVQLGLRCDEGLLRPDHVVYLVQDWEPGFFAWGTEYALARSTYERGFHLLVNSAPLAGYLAAHTGHAVPADQVIAPQVDEERLRTAAAAWRPGEPDSPRLLYYARPSKPRNTYTLGLAALRRWAAELPPRMTPIVTFAGEDFPAPAIGARVHTRAAGKLTFDDYYALLAETDLGLTLMHSPHPSHLALELPMAGIPTVTNALEGHRVPWVDGLQVVDPVPTALAAALRTVTDELVAAPPRQHAFVPLTEPLGMPLGDCLDALLERLPAGISAPGAGSPAGSG